MVLHERITKKMWKQLVFLLHRNCPSGFAVTC